jgi:hypothetical protein
MYRIMMAAGLLALSANGADANKRVNAGLIYDTIPHIVNGASWKTTIVLANIGTIPQRYALLLHGDDGAPKAFEFIGRGSASRFEGEIPRGATLTFETTGRGDLSQGWAEVEMPSGGGFKVGAMAIFGTTGIPGRPDFEATVPAWSTVQFEGILPFDNSNGYVTSVAVLNPSPFSASTVPVIVYDEGGNVLRMDTITLRAGHKTAFTIPEKWPEAAGRRGSVHFQGPLTSWSVIGLRFNPGGAFTTVNLLEP